MSHSRPRVALVTGASRGIGAACVLRLAADGMAVAINSYPDEKMTNLAEELAGEVRASGGNTAVYPADVSDASSVETMFDRCESELGRVSALVLNAAATARLPWTDIDEPEWERVIATNLRGAFHCCRRAFGRPDSPTEGSIVTVSSVRAKVGAPTALHYGTTKAGLLGFTRSLARELGGKGIRVNCVMPGAIRTEEELESFPDQAGAERIALAAQAIQRRGLATDVAGVVSFLVGRDSAFMTGQTLCVDGGWVFV